MRKFAVLFVSFGMLAFAACGGGGQDGEAAASPLLYEIANSDGEVEGWMLGTIHALPDDTEWRNAAIDRVAGEADSLLVEVPGMDDQAGIAATFAELAITPDLGPLPPRIDPSLHDDLAVMLARSDASLDRLEDTETWAAAILLSQVDAVGNPRNGVDRALIREFEGRPVRGFETPGLQLGVFDSLAEEDQRDLLEGTVREWAASRDRPGWLTQAWLKGDLAVLEDATTKGIMADPELRAALLVDRNLRWMPTLLANLRSSERPLVAVGTAHIVGPDGLPAMLEAQGYTIRRIE